MVVFVFSYFIVKQVNGRNKEGTPRSVVEFEIQSTKNEKYTFCLTSAWHSFKMNQQNVAYLSTPLVYLRKYVFRFFEYYDKSNMFLKQFRMRVSEFASFIFGVYFSS